MAWDKEHILRLVHEVRNTKGVASFRKSEELLEYVTSHRDKEDSSREVASDASEQNQQRPEPS